MKTKYLVGFASVVSLVFTTAASNLGKRLVEPVFEPKVVLLDYEKQKVPADHPRLRKRYVGKRSPDNGTLSLRKIALGGRAEIVETPLDNSGGLLYYVSLSIGTPPQHLNLQLGTGSSDMWVESAVSSYCLERNNPCDQGSYDPSSSTTYKLVEAGGFNITYVDTTHAIGNYFEDTVDIGNITILSQQMGLAIDTDIPEGILGIGYIANEAANTSNEYPGLVYQLVRQKKIKSKAYSVWLDDLDSTTGSLLFGGVDTAKYSGDLIGTPIIIPAGEAPTYFTVEIIGIVFTQANGTSTTISAAITNADFDVGTSFIYLPLDMVSMIGNLTNATLNNGKYVVDCKLRADTESRLTFSFGTNGPSIDVYYSQLVLDQGGVCFLAIDVGDATLGDSFIRATYMVYDLDGQEIFMAPPVFNATDSKILEIEGAQSGGVLPLSTLLSITASETSSSSSQATTASSISGAITNTNAASTYPATSPAISPASNTASPTSQPKKSIVAPVVGSVVPVVAIAGLLGLFLLFRRRRDHRDGDMPAPPPPSGVPPMSGPNSPKPYDQSRQTWGSGGTMVPPVSPQPNASVFDRHELMGSSIPQSPVQEYQHAAIPYDGSPTHGNMSGNPHYTEMPAYEGTMSEMPNSSQQYPMSHYASQEPRYETQATRQ